MRLATSGPLHNLILYLTFLVLAQSGLSNIFWTDISDIGRVVQVVHRVSIILSLNTVSETDHDSNLPFMVISLLVIS